VDFWLLFPEEYSGHPKLEAKLLLLSFHDRTSPVYIRPSIKNYDHPLYHNLVPSCVIFN
jgi:hypothetical protein